MDYDAIIVGAGPAGGSAALWLGEAGQRVLVLEKARLPRYKACGGGIPKSVFARFPFDFSAVVEREIGCVRFRFRDGREMVADLPDRPVAMVMRAQFDGHILNHARAEVQDSAAVVALQQDAAGVEVVTRSGQAFRARYVIGADGAQSRVARLSGLRQGKRLALALEAEVDRAAALGGPDEFADTVLFLFGVPALGYQWVFPKADCLSVGVGAYNARASDLRPTLEAGMGHLGIRLDGARVRGHVLPIYLQHELLQRGRVLLAGDAAGLVDPLLGEGVRHAVDSGRLAAQAVLADGVAGYSQRVHRQIGDDLLWGKRFARAFYRHPWGSFELGVRNPLFLDGFVALFAGRTTYRQMAARALPYVLRGVGRRAPVQSAVPASGYGPRR